MVSASPTPRSRSATALASTSGSAWVSRPERQPRGLLIPNPRQGRRWPCFISQQPNEVTPHQWPQTPARTRRPPVPPRRRQARGADDGGGSGEGCVAAAAVGGAGRRQVTTTPPAGFRRAMQALWMELVDAHHAAGPTYYFFDANSRPVLLPGPLIRRVWMRARVPLASLASLWDQLDVLKLGGLSFDQFLLGMHEISRIRLATAMTVGRGRSGTPDTGAVPRAAGRVRAARTGSLLSCSRSASVSSASSASSFSLPDLLLPIHHPPLLLLYHAPDLSPFLTPANPSPKS